ncbi:unnamed protein product [Fraxinus pennsylvanica]|uniref:Uncharacterized protein n=1 Tax=Fraxinus pennsylvanica TaxID=56036 RepID=A0AAD1Z4S4_9LAMI|nr:unnamed protein product [Fraxinus pennsylvanica]
MVVYFHQVNIAYSSGMIFSIIDEHMGSYPSECAVKFIKLALSCCHDDTDARPSMVEVVRELESIWLMVPESDTMMLESIVSDAEKDFTPTSSSSALKTSYVSNDISGNDLVSGVFHTVRPRSERPHFPPPLPLHDNLDLGPLPLHENLDLGPKSRLSCRGRGGGNWGCLDLSSLHLLLPLANSPLLFCLDIRYMFVSSPLQPQPGFS